MTTAATSDRPADRPSTAKRAQVWLANHFAILTAVAVLIYLLPAGGLHVRLLLQRRTARPTSCGRASRWSTGRTPAARPACASRSVTSLQVGVISTLVATVLGTLIALAHGALPLPGRGREQPADLRADGHARDRAWVPPADDLRAGLLQHRPPRWASGRSSSRTSCSAISFVVVTVKARLAVPGPAARGGGRRPLRRARCRRSGGSPSRCCSRASLGAALLAFSLSASTTSSSPTSSPAT